VTKVYRRKHGVALMTDVMFHELPPKTSGIAFRECTLLAETSVGPEYSRMIVVAKIFLELLVSLALAVIPISVSARQSGDTSVSESAQEISHSESAGTFKGTEVFANVRVPIRRAIAIAETRVAGAKIVDIGFDEESDQVAYKVKTYQHNEIWTGTIDASTGISLEREL
jgi:uncharacterized membrane protein YkoI